MAEEVLIRVGAQDAASATFRAVADNLGLIETKGEAAGNKLQTLKDHWIGFTAFAAAAVGIGGSLYQLVNKTTQLGEQLKNASDKTGIAVEDLSTLKYAAEQTNVGFEPLNQALYLFAVRIGRAAEKAADNSAFERLGIKIKDQEGRIRPVYDLFLDVAEALRNTRTAAERADLQMELFGRGAANLAPLLLTGKQGIIDLQTEASSLGLEMSTKTAVAADDFRDSLDALKGSVSGFAMTVTTDMVPVLTSGVQYLTSWVQLLREAVTFDPGRQQAAQRTIQLTKDQATAIQDQTVKLGFFDDALRTTDATMLQTRVGTINLTEMTSSMKDTVAATGDALRGYQDALVAVQTKSDSAAAGNTAVKTASEAMARSIETTVTPKLESMQIDLTDLGTYTDDLTSAFKNLDEQLSEPIEFPMPPPPPPSTFMDFVRSFASAFTEPAGKDVIQTALINAFTDISQGGGFKSAIAAVGVAIGTAIGGPAGGAVVGLFTQAISQIGGNIFGESEAEKMRAREAAESRATAGNQRATAERALGRVVESRLISRQAMDVLGEQAGWPAVATVINEVFPQLKAYGEAFKWLVTLNPQDPRYRGAESQLRTAGFIISAQQGLLRVPGPESQSVPAVLHGGEMVVPARQAEAVRSSRDMAGGVTVNFYLQSASDRELVGMIRSQLPMIEQAVSEGIRKGARFGTQEFDSRMIRTTLQS